VKKFILLLVLLASLSFSFHSSAQSIVKNQFFTVSSIIGCWKKSPYSGLWLPEVRITVIPKKSIEHIAIYGAFVNRTDNISMGSNLETDDSLEVGIKYKISFQSLKGYNFIPNDKISVNLRVNIDYGEKFNLVNFTKFVNKECDTY
jgi:hypothetical protein